MLFFPSKTVHVIYQSGRDEDVAMQDSLTKLDAEHFIKYWSKPNNKVIKVILVDQYRNIVKEYNNEGGM